MPKPPNLPPDPQFAPRHERPRKGSKPKAPAPAPAPALPAIRLLRSEAPPITVREIEDAFRVPSRAERLAMEMRKVGAEMLRRWREGLRLYEPMPVQAAFHASRAKTRLLRGSTRGGKTLPAAVELARAVLGKDPHGKYPARGTVYIVGYDYAHHGQTIYPKLFEPGALRLIRDLRTDAFRAWRPWEPSDLARKSEAIDAEPLIPHRYVEEIAWEKKKERVPSLIRLTTGWDIYFFSGDGRPPRGQPIDIGWLDEEIGNGWWYSELVSRCIDRDGRIVWSAAPQSGTVQLYELHELAEQQRGHERPTVAEFVIKLADNAFLTAEQKADAAASLTSEAAQVTQIEGEFLHTGQRVYPEWSLRVHGKAMRAVPDHWTRYAVIDPGYQITAVLFGACPPPEECEVPGELVLYDELYVPRCSATILAEKMSGKSAGVWYEDFVIDDHGSRIHESGTGRTVYDQYAEAFAAKGVRCHARSRGFAIGNDNVVGGIEIVRKWLRPGQHSAPRLRLLCETLPSGQVLPRLENFQFEILRYGYQRDPKTGLVTDKPEERGRVHLCACLRYLCSYNPRFVPRESGVPRPDSPAFLAMQRKRQGAGRRVGTVFGPKRET